MLSLFKIPNVEDKLKEIGFEYKRSREEITP